LSPTLGDAGSVKVRLAVNIYAVSLTPVVFVLITDTVYSSDFEAKEFVTVVAKLGSSPKAAASSFNVSNVEGAVSTRLATAVVTYVSVAYDCSE